MKRGLAVRCWHALVFGAGLLAGFNVSVSADGLMHMPSAHAAAPTGAVSFAPHRAVYDITLKDAAVGSGVAELSGRMVYELSGSSCDGYSQKMRFVTRIADREGLQQLNDLRTSSWEAAKGKRLRFSLDQYHNDELAEAIQGAAKRLGEGPAPVGVQLTKPARKDLTLKPDVVFPMQHSQGLMRAAKTGARVFSANLFDGSEKGEKVYFTNAVIGDATPTAEAANVTVKAVASKLQGLTAWPISIGYFDPAKTNTDALPAYELSFLFFENGVSRRLMIDYGDFSIRGQLAELTMLPVAACDAP